MTRREAHDLWNGLLPAHDAMLAAWNRIDADPDRDSETFRVQWSAYKAATGRLAEIRARIDRAKEEHPGLFAPFAVATEEP